MELLPAKRADVELLDQSLLPDVQAVQYWDNASGRNRSSIDEYDTVIVCSGRHREKTVAGADCLELHWALKKRLA